MLSTFKTLMHLVQKTPISLHILVTNSTPTYIQNGPLN